MTGVLFIRDLAIVLAIAGGVAWLCRRVGLSVVVGYLAAGAIVGPFTPPFALVTDLDRVQTLAQIGLVFLIFSIGLNLSLSRLRRLGLSVIVATIIGAILMLNGCRLLGWALGWNTLAGLFLAAMLMVSSSAIIGKVLDELNQIHERPGQMALGITVLEDVIAVFMLTLLSSLLQFGGSRAPALLPTLGAMGAFVLLLAIALTLVAPRLLARLSRTAPPEIRTLVVAGLLLSLAWLAVRAGYSLALGAFVFGASVGSTRYRGDLQQAFEGLQQIFGAVFFVAVGMQVDFHLFLSAWPMVLAVTALALLLRPIACSLGLVAVGNTSREAIQAGLILTPMGEFSFIIAQLGVDTGALPPSFYPVAVGASLLTSLAAPLLSRHAETLSARIVRLEPRRVREWIGFYHDWLTRLRNVGSTSLLWRLTKGRLLQAALLVALVSALILFANPIFERVRGMAAQTWLFPRGSAFIFWGAFGLVLLAPLIALWRHVSALAMILAESATIGTPRQQRLRPILESALRGVALIILAAWLLALLPPGWVRFGSGWGVVLLLAMVGVLFWRRFVHLHSRLEIELAGQLRRASHAASASGWSHALPRQSADWNLDIDEVTLPSDSAHAGHTVGHLEFRRRFGCSLIGIDRQGFAIATPGADTPLYPRDKLLLLGTPEQLAHAARELTGASVMSDASAGFDELTMESVTVPTDSPLAEKPLSTLHLIREAGVQIGAIRRGLERNLAPSGEDRLAAGDEVLVLGTHLQIKKFIALLSPPPPAAGTKDTDEGLPPGDQSGGPLSHN